MKKYLLIFCIGLTALVSCSKDASVDPTKQKLLSKMSLATPTNTSVIAEYLYDDQQRFKEIREVARGYITKVFYTADGKIERDELYHTAGDLIQTTYYSYNGNTITIRIEHAPSTLIITGILASNGQLISESQNGNITVSYEYDSKGNNVARHAMYSTTVDDTYTYDNKVGIFKAVKTPVWWMILHGNYPNINNILTESTSSSIYTTQYQFEYDSDGYPIKRTSGDAANGVVKYEYIK